MRKWISARFKVQLVRSLSRRIARRFRGIFSSEFPWPILAAAVAALAILVVLVMLYVFIPDLRRDYWAGVYVAATGFLFDIVFFGILLALITHKLDKIFSAQRYQEEIQDFKRWNTEEGRLRIAGAIRRLERMGKTDIDFVGITLSDFRFRYHGIQSIAGSKFYEGEWGTASIKDDMSLEKVDFSNVDCSNVIFSRFNPFEGFGLPSPAKISNCRFLGSNLTGAIFNGAILEWAEIPPAQIYEETENPDGSPSLVQVDYPPFDDANLANASFRNTRFINADFRNARNILDADFLGAEGLYSCVFDDDSVKAAVIRNASKNKT